MALLCLQKFAIPSFTLYNCCNPRPLPLPQLMSIVSDRDRRQQSGLTRFSFELSVGKLCKPKKETATTAARKVKDNDA